ncbi:MAG: hypothetical protein ACRCWF_01765 [Beijerinckiaceae bacterium]
MLARRLVILVAITLALAGCVTLPPIKFSPDEIRGWRYVGTRVVSAPDGQFAWHGQDTAFAETKGVRQGAMIVDPAGGQGAADSGIAYTTRVRQLITTEPTRGEYQRFIVSQATGPISAAMGEQLGGQMTGGREVRAEVTLKQIIINHTALRLLADLMQTMKVEIALVDAKTGERLAHYPEFTAIVRRTGGVTGILLDSVITGPDIDMLSKVTAGHTRGWLFSR